MHSASAPQETFPAESGVYAIFSASQRIGTETFQIRSTESGLIASGELELQLPGGARVREGCSMQLDDRLRPTSYERRQKAPKSGSITVLFRPEGTTLVSETEAKTQEQVFYLSQEDLVVLDTNFFHHYSLLLRQYRRAQPSPRHFNVFIPQEALPGTISVEYLGREPQVTGRSPAELDHFRMTTEELTIEIWATVEGVIQRIQVPQANLEIVRQAKS